MADYGLNALATTMGKDYFGEGEKHAADLQSSLASTASTRANTARTEGLTPLEIERARLGNLQGQSDEQAGVYGAKSEQGLWEAKQKARQAQQAWQQLPEEHKIQMIKQTKEKTSAVIKGAASQVMATGNAMAAVEYIEQNLPEVTKDKGWETAKQQYSKMSPDQALAKLNDHLARMASSDAYSSPEQQSKMISEEQKHGYDMELEGLRGQNQLKVTNARPPGSDNLTGPELTERYLSIYQDDTQPPAVREKARQALEYLAKASAQTKEGLLGPQTTTKETLLPSPTAPRKVTIPRDAITHLLNNPGTAAAFEEHYGIQPGWAEEYIRNNRKGK